MSTSSLDHGFLLDEALDASWMMLPRPFLLIPQEREYWCWAAVAFSIAVHQGKSRWSEQSLLAGDFLSHKNPGGPKVDCSGNACDKIMSDLGEVLGWMRAFNISAGTHPKKEFTEILSEIAENRPVCIRFEPKNKTPHVAVIDACRMDDSRTLRVRDPAKRAPVEVPYDALVAGTYGQEPGLWTHTYFTARM